jgi:hypothetical protein
MLRSGRVMRWTVGLGAVIAVSAAVGVASGAIPGAGGKLGACYTKVGGVVRVIDTQEQPPEKCVSSLEKALSFNTRAPGGPPGAPGAPGDSRRTQAATGCAARALPSARCASTTG